MNTVLQRRLRPLSLLLAGLLVSAESRAEDGLATRASADIAAAHAAIAADNPAELWEIRGAALWRTPAGPQHVSLEQCDLGLGPGQVAGASTQLPRWFADAGQVMDLEQRLVWCRMAQQGLRREDAEADHFGDGARQSSLEALSAWIASQSRGQPVTVPASHPEEQRLLALGRRFFFYRAGPYDFSCATCHATSDRRVRLQPVPNLTDPAEARTAWTTWPAYRLSQGEVRTMQHRLYDCLRQQRLPEAVYGSELITALSLYLAHQAEGGRMAAPGLKR